MDNMMERCRTSLNSTLNNYRMMNPTKIDKEVKELLEGVMILDNPVLTPDLIINQLKSSYFPTDGDVCAFINSLYTIKTKEFIDMYLDIFLERLYNDEVDPHVIQTKVDSMEILLGSMNKEFIDIIKEKNSEYGRQY